MHGVQRFEQDLGVVAALVDRRWLPVQVEQACHGGQAVRTEYSTVNTTSSGTSAYWPMKARLVDPAGTTSGRSPALRTRNWLVMYGIRAGRTVADPMRAEGAGLTLTQ